MLTKEEGTSITKVAKIFFKIFLTREVGSDKIPQVKQSRYGSSSSPPASKLQGQHGKFIRWHCLCSGVFGVYGSRIGDPYIFLFGGAFPSLVQLIRLTKKSAIKRFD